MTSFVSKLTTLLVILINQVVGAQELLPDKVCPVIFSKSDSFTANSLTVKSLADKPLESESNVLGILVISKAWFHNSGQLAGYIAKDDATGIGVEIHFFANNIGQVSGHNIAQCDRYRLLQVRAANIKRPNGEEPIQIDVPDNTDSPFYDNGLLEHGYGSHQTPVDSDDKPWVGRPTRASTVAIYDTPFTGDSLGIDGLDIKVAFETCVVCQRDNAIDSILSCVNWGYQRDLLEPTGQQLTSWSEPDILERQCHVSASEIFSNALDGSHRIEYLSGLDWQ
ncbi:MAG: hypothetical protein HRU23_02830 [Gammaproteobacteria bacterium]|nr:hypothetical protein [Gammaproteobacteria bacterium]